MLRESEQAQFEIIPLSALQKQSGGRFALKAHRHNYYAMVIITGGEGTHFIDFNACDVRDGSLFLIAPGQVHFWKVDSALSGYELLFTEEFLVTGPSDRFLINELSFLNSRDGGDLILPDPTKDLIRDLTDLIYKEYRADSFGRTAVLKSYVHILLVHIQRLCLSSTPTGEASVVQKFKRLVVETLSEKRSVQGYAELLGISPGHLSDFVKTVTGKTPGQIIRQETVLEARRILAYTDMTVAEAGYMLGFEDPSYFGRFFTRETGMAPAAFRSKSS